MSATPITPGRAYRVTWRGRVLILLADHPCQAINLALEIFNV